MREGYEGSSTSEGENLVPRDAVIYYSGKSYAIFYSPSRNKLYVKTYSYHPGELELSLEDIESTFMFLIENRKQPQ